jgi:UDP-3-O-[3-hydroxymyristoyl] glucosamine N-acyltransferase LpxD
LRFRAGVTVGDVLRLCRPLPDAASGPAGSKAPTRPPESLPLASLDAPDLAGPGSLTFLGPRTPLRWRRGPAALFLAEAGVEPDGPEAAAIPLYRVPSIYAAMAAILTGLADRLEREAPFPPGPGNRIAPTAVVEGCLEGDVTVAPGAYVAKGSFIGAGSRIGANAVIEEHCRLGRNCVVQAGAVIGCAGFGFYPEAAGLIAMPHPAGVDIGAECWIGANAVVAAGVLNPTVLGRGCKLDSHVQIAHNVRLGDGCALASQSGIAGSTVAGHRLRMGGAASVDGHLRLGNDVSVAACSGVTKDVADGETVAGFPARPIGEWRRGLARGK